MRAYEFVYPYGLLPDDTCIFYPVPAGCDENSRIYQIDFGEFRGCVEITRTGEFECEFHQEIHITAPDFETELASLKASVTAAGDIDSGWEVTAFSFGDAVSTLEKHGRYMGWKFDGEKRMTIECYDSSYCPNGKTRQVNYFAQAQKDGILQDVQSLMFRNVQELYRFLKENGGVIPQSCIKE